MPLNYQKELTPVLYGDSAVKILDETIMPANRICFGTHWHERMELLLVLSGTLTVHIGGTEYYAEENRIVIIPPGRPHTGASGKDGVRYRTVMFDVTAFYNSAVATEKYLKPIVNQQTDFIPVTDNKAIVGLLHSIINEQVSRDAVFSLVVIGKIYELLGLLYRYCLSDNSYGAVYDGRFNNVIDYIEEHFCEVLSTYDLSRMFGYSEAYFCRRFKSVTGITPVIYIQILRLEKAQQMMQKTDLKISEISSACGFSDISYFSRCFKKQFGITPSEAKRK